MTSRRNHFIQFTHDPGFGIKPKFVCTEPSTAPCRNYPNCECESLCFCTPVPHEYCGYQPFMDEDCAMFCFFGKLEEKVRSGRIDLERNDDCVRWSYA